MNNHLSDDQLVNYTYRTLTDNQREIMDLHLKTCQVCRVRLTEQDALHRRVHYSIIARRKQAVPSPQMNFTAVAPRLKRPRRFPMFVRLSNQFLYGATTLVVLILLAVGLVTIFGNFNQSPSNSKLKTPPPAKQPHLAAADSPDINPTSPAARPIDSSQDEAELEATNGYIVVDNLKVYYETMGSGPPLVLIHDSWLHREVWDAQFETFARDYTVIRYDRRGYGLSESNDMGYINIEDLHALLQHLNIDHATLVGSSYGGQMAVDFALDYPEMVDALVLVGAPLSGSSVSDFEWRRVVFDRFFGIYRPSGRLHSPDEAQEAIRVWFDLPRSNYWILPENAEVREQARQLLLANPQNLIHRRLIREPEPPANGRLSQIQVPTLVIVGEGDIADVHIHADRIAAGIAGAEKVIIPHAGHLVHLEQPEIFNQTVADFLQQQR